MENIKTASEIENLREHQKIFFAILLIQVMAKIEGEWGAKNLNLPDSYN